MPRPPRIEVPGATYHVYARGNRRADVFGGAAEYLGYLEDLERIARQHGAFVHAFCLMPNHTHLCLRTGLTGDPLSVLMQRLNLRHARRFNAVRDVRGRLNEARYGSQVVADERYLLCLVRYIHLNPVRANLVPAPEQWPFSSHLAYLGRAFPWVTTGDVLARLGGVGGYSRWVGVPAGDEERAFRPDARGRRLPIVGAEAAVGPSKPSPFGRRASDQAIAARAADWAQANGVDLEALQAPERDRATQQLRVGLALHLRGLGYALGPIARVIGRGESATSLMILRARGVAEAEPSYAEPEPGTGSSSASLGLPRRIPSAFIFL